MWLFYRCCEVGDRAEEGRCWICGSEDYDKAINLDIDPVYESYYRFIYNGRVQGCEGEPPWRM